MSIIVEDGTGLATATSYVTRADLIAYAAARGVTIADTAASDILMIKAVDYMETYESRYVGSRASATQALAWPRTGAVIRGFAVEGDDIPYLVQQAQMEIAMDLHAGVDLYNRDDRPFVERESVDGSVEVAYATPSVVSARIVQSQALRGMALVTTGGYVSLERR